MILLDNPTLALRRFISEIIIFGGDLAEVCLIINKARRYAKKKVFLPALAKTLIVVSGIGQTVVAFGVAWIASRLKNNDSSQ